MAEFRIESDDFKEGEEILKNGNPDRFGELLNEAWLEKRGLSSSVTNYSIDDIYKNAIKYIL